MKKIIHFLILICAFSLVKSGDPSDFYTNSWDATGDCEPSREILSGRFGPTNWSYKYPDGSNGFFQSGYMFENCTDSLFGDYSLNFSTTNEDVLTCAQLMYYINVTPSHTYQLSAWARRDRENHYYYGGYEDIGIDISVRWYNSSLDYVSAGITIASRSDYAPLGEWVFYEGTATAPADIGEGAFALITIYWVLHNGSSIVDGVWVEDVTGELNNTIYVDVGLGDYKLNTHHQSDNLTENFWVNGNEINVTRISGTVYNLKTIDYLPRGHGALTDSYVENGTWEITVSNITRIKKLYSDGSSGIIILYPGLNTISDTLNVTGFYFINSTLNLTYSIQNIDFGDIQVDTITSPLYFNLTNYDSMYDIIIIDAQYNSNFSLSGSPFCDGTWESIDGIINRYGVATSSSGQYVTLSNIGGYIYTSDNYGVNWTQRASTLTWREVAMSDSGQYQIACAWDNYIYTSDNYGVNWTVRKNDTVRNWIAVNTDSSGQYQTAVHYGGQIYVSNDYGITWVAKGTNDQWYSIAISDNGSIQTVVNTLSPGAGVYISTDYGHNWTYILPISYLRGISLSANGQYMTALGDNDYIYTSDNYGVNWTQRASTQNWWHVAMSDSGQFQVAGGNGFPIYSSNDYGYTWESSNISDNIKHFAMSSTGQYQYAVGANSPGYKINYSYNYVIHPNSFILINFTAIAPFYIDSDFNQSCDFLLDNRYGVIPSPSAYMSFKSSTPFLRHQSNLLPLDRDNWTENTTFQFETAFWDSYTWVDGVVGNEAPQYNLNWTNLSSTEPRLLVPDSYASSLDVMSYEYVGFWFKLDMSDDAWSKKWRVFWYFTDPSYNVVDEWVDNFDQELSGIERNEWRYIELNWNPTEYGDEWDRIRMYLQFNENCDGWYNLTLDGFRFYNKSLNFGDIQVDITSDESYLYLINEGSPNPIVITNITLDSRFVFASNLTEWNSRDANRVWQDVAISSTGKYQTAADYSGYLYVSSDFGVTWAAKGSSGGWYAVSMSSNGMHQTAGTYGGQIYVSHDYGETWTAKNYTGYWNSIDMSLTGQHQVASWSLGGGFVYISHDYGETWTQSGGYRNWRGASISGDGQYVTTVGFFEQIYVSNDFGATWYAKQSSRRWFGVDMSSTGQYQTAIDYSGAIYISSDYGQNWISKASSKNWNVISISSTGQYQTAGVIPGSLYSSSDYGHNWTVVNNSDNKNWEGVAMSSCGIFQTAVDSGGMIYTYSLYGVRVLPNSYLLMNFSVIPPSFIDSIYNYSFTGWEFDITYGSISQDPAYFTYLSSKPFLSFGNSIYFGDIKVDDFSQLEYVELVNSGSPNNITITSFSTSFNDLELINNSFNYVVLPNDTLLLYFTARPYDYADSVVNRSFYFSLDNTYGYISYDLAYAAYLSTTPTYEIQYNTYNDTNGYIGNVPIDTPYSGYFSVYKTNDSPNDIDFLSLLESNDTYNSFTYDFPETEFNPKIVNSQDTSDSNGVFVKDGIMYVADGSSGVKLYNVSNILDIQLLDYHDPYDGWFVTGQDVRVEGDIMYVAGFAQGIDTYNVSDPSNIIHLDTFGGVGFATYLEVNDSIVYVGGLNYNVSILNCSDPSNIQKIGSFNFSEYFPQYTWVVSGLSFSDNTLFVTMDAGILNENLEIIDFFGGELVVLDVSNPSIPALLTNYSFDVPILEVAIKDDVAYCVTFFERGLDLLNVSDLDNIYRISNISSNTNWSNVFIDPYLDYVYVVDSITVFNYDESLLDRIVVVNTSDLSSLSIDRYLYYEDTGKTIFVDQNYIYASDNGTGFKIWQKQGIHTVNDTYNLSINFSNRATQYLDNNYTFNLNVQHVDGDRGIIVSSLGINYSLMSSTPYLSTSGDNNIDFLNVELDSSTPYECINYTNIGSPNTLTINEVLLNDSFAYVIIDTNYGNSWSSLESMRAWRSISMSSSGKYQTAVASSDRIYVSSDYGYMWSAKDSVRDWFGVSISSTGQYQTAIEYNGYIYISSDYGNTWASKDSIREWYGVSISSTGQYQTAVDYNGYIYVSSDYGVTWAAKDSARNWVSVSISSTGQNQTAVALFDYIYVSSDYGNSWTPKDSVRDWHSVAISSSGKYQTAVERAGINSYIYVSSDYGNTWVQKGPSLVWGNVGMSSTGQYQTVGSAYGSLYLSDDYGVTWILQPFSGEFMDVSISDDGSHQAFVANGDYIYESATYSSNITLYSNDYVLICYSATPTSYHDYFNYTILFDLDDTHGSINYSVSTLSFNSSQPSLSNLLYSYNGSYIDVLPEDTLAFNLSINNTNLNTIQIKKYYWTMQDATLNTNFSTMVSPQYVYNSTYSIIDVIREVSSFSQRVQTVLIEFYGIGSEDSNNVFNLTITPNFTMVDLGYAYNVLTEFLDKEIDTSYDDTWTLFSTGTYDFNVTTRIDNYSNSDFTQTEWSNIDGVSSYHTIDLNNIYKIEFENPLDYNHAELWINVSANSDIDLRVTINGNEYTLAVTPGWSVQRLYTDDLLESNVILFELDVLSGFEIYIQNASFNSNLSLYSFNPIDGWVELTSCFAIDFLFSDFIIERQIEKYGSDPKLQILGGADNDWDLIYFPSTYTDSSRVNVRFILTNFDGRYLDNFTFAFEFETPREVYIISNMDDLDIDLYIGETNEFNILFENIGTRNASVVNVTSSLPFLTPIYVGKDLFVNTPINISFVSNDLLTIDYEYDFLVLTVTMYSTYGGFFDDYMYVFIDTRPSFVLVQPSDATRYIEREQDEIVTTSFTIRNDGEGDGYYSVYIIDPNNTLDHNTLTYLDTSFYLEPGEEKTIEFQISGDVISDNETFYVELEQDGDVVSIFTITVKTTETTKPKSWTWGLLLWIVALVTLIGAFIIRRRFSKKNGRDQVEIDKRDEYNYQKERLGYGERKPTSKLQMKQMGRKVFIGVVFFAVLALILIPVYLWYQGSYKAPWEIGSAIKDQM